jgi:hypothetical protein
MNILQVQDALKNASDMQLSGELQNPTGLAPSYLVLSEMKRRQQMRQGAQQGQAPQSSMAEEAASQAEYYPEEQPQEEESGIEAFREGGVVRMAEGGAAEFDPLSGLGEPEPRRNRLDINPLQTLRDIDAWARRNRLPGMAEQTSPQRLQEFTEQTRRMQRARERGDIVVPPQPDYTAQGFEQEEPFARYRPAPASPAGERPASTEGQMPPTTVTAQAPSQPSAAASAPRGGGAMPSGAAQPTGQTTDPTIQALYDRLRATGRGREDYRKDAVNTALMQAGLAMMSSQSPNALSNLGQGGLRGLESYTQEMREGRQGERQSIQDEITIRRAQTEEAYRRGMITNQERMIRLSELRAGEAAGDRAERRRERGEDRQRELDIRAEGNLRAALPDITRRIAAINEQLTGIPQRRNPAQETEYQNLIRARGELETYAGQIRQRLMTSAGIEANVPAQTQNAPGLPPGAVVRQF